MLRCLAIDDEPLALDLLEDSISRIPYLELVAKCSDAFQAMQIMAKRPVDLVFLDIQMPGLTGLQFLESSAQKPMAILITAYQKFALEGYSLNVVDYLLKPVEFTRFVAACNKAWDLHQLKISRQTNQSPANGYLFVPAEYSLVRVQFADVLWIEGWKDYLKIYLADSTRPVITRMSLKDLQEQLPTSLFLRIHKSFIVSLQQVTALKKSSVFIKEKELPVGETYREAVELFTKKNPPL